MIGSGDDASSAGERASADERGAARMARALERAREIVTEAAAEGRSRAVGAVLAEIDRALGALTPEATARRELRSPEPTGAMAESEALRREIERLRATAERDRERSPLDAILAHAPHGLVVADTEGRFVVQNRAAEWIWGGSATVDDLDTWGQYRAFHADGRPYAPGDWAMARALAKGETSAAEEIRFQRFDGTHGVLVASAAPVVDAGGRVTGAVMAFADVTHLKAGDDERARLLARASIAASARDELLAIVSHDLRNPLNVVSMGTSALLRGLGGGPNDDATRRQLERIARAAGRMDDLVRNLLDASSIEAGRFPCSLADVDVETLATEALDLLSPLAGTAVLRLDMSDATARTRVRADRSRVQQVFSNLVGNAFHVTRDGGLVLVRVRLADTHVRFSVEDSGPGISEEMQERIFDRWWHARRSAHAGAGLGLYIAKGIVDAHGGTIRVESRPGAGATFVFTLPRVTGASIAPPTDA